MKTNLYEYNTQNTQAPVASQQHHMYANPSGTASNGQQQASLVQKQKQHSDAVQKAKPAARMPKTQTLALVRTLKRWLVVTSLVGFGTFSGLAIFHQVGSTTSTQSNQTSSGSSQTTSTTTSSSQNNSSFLNQGGNNLGSSTSSSSTAPVTSSHVS